MLGKSITNTSIVIKIKKRDIFFIQRKNKLKRSSPNYAIEDRCMRDKLDSIDQKIIQILQKNAREKNTEIARQLNITEGAVRKRIKKLLERGIIEGFTIRLSEQMAGIRAIVGVNIGGTVEPGKVRDKIFEKIPHGIEAIYETTGDIDLFVILHMQKDVHLKNAIESIRKVNGVEHTTTFVVLTKSVSQPEFLQE